MVHLQHELLIVASQFLFIIHQVDSQLLALDIVDLYMLKQLLNAQQLSHVFNQRCFDDTFELSSSNFTPSLLFFDLPKFPRGAD